MRSISYKDYLDKVYGCFQGKCIAGTIGAPYEGMKQILNIDYAPELFENMVPNDDLDLQVLWLEVLEKKGIYFTSDHLAEAFLNQCPYSPGEYAVFKKNYRRGLHPPESGWFNNSYYLEGMGCPIRSEIWACLAPGNSELAARLAAVDGIMDHSGNSVYAEQFLAALEAEAFFESDLEKVIQLGLKQIPATSKIAGLIKNVERWCSESTDWKSILSKIIQQYGHPDCTNLFQNMGITIMALLLGKKNFVETTMMALNCGFDTDCTCATSGAILGTILGAERMKLDYGYVDQRYILGVDAGRRSDSIHDLAEDICIMGMHFAEKLNSEVQIEGFSGAIIRPLEEEKPELIISAKYEGMPVIGVGEERKVSIVFSNNTDELIKGNLAIAIPDSWNIAEYQTEISVNSGGKNEIELILSVPSDIDLLQETNIILVKLRTDVLEYVYEFGVVGAAAWRVYGPYWENTVNIGSLKPGESYIDHIAGEGLDDTTDKIRQYHLNTMANFDKDYLNIAELALQNSGLIKNSEADNSNKVNIYEDKFSVNDIIGFQGPCVVYMTRELISPDEREINIHVGHTDAFELWINGTLFSKKTNVDWWTAENVHISSVHLNKGLNKIVLKLARRTEKSDFSLAFLKTEGGMCGVMAFPEHFTDFASKYS